MHKVLRKLKVELGERSYPIIIGQGLLGSFDLTRWVAGQQVMIVTNDTVGPLYLEKVKGCFPEKRRRGYLARWRKVQGLADPQPDF